MRISILKSLPLLGKKADKWEIGVKERCEDCDIKQFNTEAEACQAFLEEFYPEILNGPKCL